MKINKRGLETPWGPTQQIEKISEGITWCSTASHGGYYVSNDLDFGATLSRMPEKYRSFKPWAGIGWYEEDCDWAIVCLAYPKEFEAHYGERYPEMKAAAERTVNGQPEYFKIAA